MKKYCYEFIDINEKFYADTGDECLLQYNDKYHDHYEGTIKLTNLQTGESHMMYPVKFK